MLQTHEALATGLQEEHKQIECMGTQFLRLSMTMVYIAHMSQEGGNIFKLSRVPHQIRITMKLLIFHPWWNGIWNLSFTYTSRWMANCLTLVFLINWIFTTKALSKVI